MNAVPRGNRATRPHSKLAIMATAIALVWSLLSATTATADDTIVIPDANLAACISAELTKESLPSDLTAANLAKITTLSCATAVADLSGIEALTGMSSLTLSSMTATDVTALGTLTGLTKLRLYASELVDPAPLARLTGLQELQLTAWKVSNTDFVAPLANLERAILSISCLADLSDLAALTKLSSLALCTTSSQSSILAQLDHVTDLSIRTADDTLTGLVLPPAVKTLTLTNQTVSELGALPLLETVTSLTLSATALTTLDGIERLPNLTTVKIFSSSLADISALSQESHLRALTIANSKVSSADPLSGMSLTQLDLGSNSFRSLAGIAAAIAPDARVRLSFNHITDVTGLVDFPTGTSVDLSHNEVSNVSALDRLPAGTTLDLSYNRIRDFSPIPDGTPTTVTGQTIGAMSTFVGVPLDLGLRTISGEPVCPQVWSGWTCTNGVATFNTMGWYDFVAGSTFTGRVKVDFLGPSAPTPPKLRVLDNTFWPQWLAFDFDSSYWWPGPTTWRTQWFRDGKLLRTRPGLVNDQRVYPADLDHKFSVCITGYGGSTPAETVCSAPYRVTRATFPKVKLTITGKRKVGHALYALEVGTLPDKTSTRIDWLRDGRLIKGQHHRRYRLRKADLGHRISVRITRRNKVYLTGIQTSAPTARIKR